MTNSLPVIIVGVIGLVSVIWQFSLFANDELDYDIPVRVRGGLIVGGIVLLGVIMYSSYLVLDPQRPEFTFFTALKNVGLAALFATLFLLKSFFGPLVLGYLAGYSVFKFFEYDELMIAPGIDWLLSLVFNNIPPSLEIAYTIIVTLYLIAVSGIDLDI